MSIAWTSTSFFLMETGREFGMAAPVLGCLDAKDAFLQVEQERPLQVPTASGRFRVLRNLPGEKIGARAWFDHLVAYLEGKGFTFCVENPCLGKFGDQLRLLIHVDDVMFMGRRRYLEQIFLREITKVFDISESTLTKPQKKDLLFEA